VGSSFVAAVRGPAVTYDRAGVVLVDDLARLVEAPSLRHPINGEVDVSGFPQPRRTPPDPPARLVHHDHGRGVGLPHQFLSYGHEAGRGLPFGCLAQCPGGHDDAEAGHELLHLHPAEAEAVMQEGGPGLRGWANPRAGGAQGVRDLVGVVALDAAATALAAADADPGTLRDRSHLADVDLPLLGVSFVLHFAATTWAAGR
jgi:hypothetical protein